MALSIQSKFAVWSALVTTAAVVLFASGTLLNLYHVELEGMDQEMASEAAVVQQRLARDNLALPAGIDFHPSMAYAVFGPDGRLEHLTPRLDPGLARTALLSKEPVTAGEDPSRWRLRAYLGPKTVVIGYNLDEVGEIVHNLLLSYLMSLPLVIVAAALGGRWVARRALQPLRSFARTTETVVADRLDVRLPQPAANDELRQLASAFNVMLSRLQTSFGQTQRFAADASHELRTPLTIMRTEIEQLLRLPAHTPIPEERLMSLQEELSRLDRITEHLLMLAQFDAGQAAGLPREPVNFSALVREAAEDGELLAAAEDITLRSTVADDVWVRGDPLLLRRLLLNVIDNAMHYNERHGAAELSLTRIGETAFLRVRNTGPGIPEAARADLFQRFFRADAARRRGGHGLGLALCREIARSHGGEIWHEETAPGWTDFVIRLPIQGT
ncbi:ATP-binding protein [Opitutus sp. ER46]|uniref:ATP-binding protein n=1 Tax=Opitutus sp. ER46 TaxID=2161864 RepID=UPI000D311809|nr:ATP-binding protein [Opitutus sp. ER46]PTY00111.1 hypothetical protein DB354_02150 [Opitutus sp. ER46]